MNEIPELKSDFAFLKSFDPRFDIKEVPLSQKQENTKEKLRCNFLLHPKRISSDSECSSSLQTPRKFLSGTVLKKFEIQEFNNNGKKQVRCNSSVLTCTKSMMRDSSVIETGAGDRDSPTLPNVKNTISSASKKQSRPSSSRVLNFDKKFKTLVERSLKLLSNIRVMFEEGIQPPDGEEDYMRRFKRVQEFSSRFSRIYLYPLLRQTDELSLPEKLATGVVNQKLLSTQQTILQGLQAYHTHLPSSVGQCGSDKLKSLLEQILYFCQLYELMKQDAYPEINEFINAMRNHVDLLLETLTNFDLKFVEKAKSKCVESIKKKKPMNKPKYNKLSMYASSASIRKEGELRKALQTLAIKKFSVKSKYRTATFKHRPPVEKPQPVEKQPKLKVFHKQHSPGVLSTPRKSPIREDDIVTMVQVESQLEAPPNSGENVNHENSIASSRQLVPDSNRGGAIQEENVEKALEVLKKFLGYSGDNDFLKQISTQIEREKNEKVQKKLKEPIVTVTGAKNAKLICIRDDNPVVEDSCKRDKEIMTDTEIKLASSETQTDIKEKTKSKSAIKISRLPRSNRMLQLLPKEFAINIIQYKLRFSQFHKHNPMYRKSVHIQPWVLMGKVSDELLDHILQSVTGELEVNEILENLYNAEFQY